MIDFDNVTVVILAGGRGTRIQDIYPDIPKPLVPVAGKPFLYWLTEWLARHGLRQFIYSTGYRADQVEEWCQRSTMSGLTRTCRPESEALGTGGGLFNCLDLCREFVLVANGDGLVRDGISALLDLCKQPEVQGGLLGVEVEAADRYGSLSVDDDDNLISFREKTPGRGLINGGIYIFRTALLRQYWRPGPLSIEYDLIPTLIAAGVRLRVVRVAGAPFIDIGTPETLRQADDFVATYLLAGPGN